ncbi:LOW QUALITY PROTEIN: neurokinin-B-like [Pipistrellus kuhlii]|uniref:LOW QUALITY PROTEIN: neurokinin-B-like n=1 Tax=Pipistrellus kuhlii TaxID=59472 RepID=UPI001E271496|nr:LOW QUALITY PROTEIN: neurokinin-B-like [Pipistrellus kuhlii]
MRSALLFVAAVLALSLALGAVGEESQEQVVPSRGRREKVPNIKELLKALTNHNSVSVVDELLKTLSQGSKDPKKRSFLQKRDMHDFFVGLMGKRNSQPGTPAEGTPQGAARSGSPPYPANME